MKSRATVIVGDIHGCLEEFEELLKTIQYHPDQIRLVLAGDLLDRGPDPVGCVRKARELGVECVLGNHEEKALRWRRHEATRQATGKANPMQVPLGRQLEWSYLNDDDLAWLNALPYQINVKDNWHVTHAGFLPGVVFDKQPWRDNIRLRYVKDGKPVPLNKDKSKPEGSEYWTNLWDGEQSIIYGHCVRSREIPSIDERPNGVKCVGIDTGCVFGGKLTGMFLESFAFVQVRAKKQYAEFKEHEE